LFRKYDTIAGLAEYMPDLPKQYQSFTYASEADVLNMAVFG